MYIQFTETIYYCLYVYVFKSGCLDWTKLLEGLSPEKTESASFSSNEFCAALYLRQDSMRFPPPMLVCQCGMVLLLCWFVQATIPVRFHGCDFPVVFRKHYLTAGTSLVPMAFMSPLFLEIMKVAGKWIELRNIILSAITQTQTDKHLSPLWFLAPDLQM